MNTPTSLLHELFQQRDLPRFRSFLSSGGGSGGNASAGSGKGKQAAASSNYSRDAAAGAGGGGASYGSLSKSPRFNGFMHGDLHATKEEVNSRDRQGRTVLHLVVTDGGDAIESTVALDAAKGLKVPLALEPEKDAAACLEFLEPLLQCLNVNVNLQDRENGWTALHRAVYAGNLVAARRLLQHHDIDASVRDLEGRVHLKSRYISR